MKKKVIELANVVLWDPKGGDKVYLENLRIVIEQFPFAVRQVFLRFANGIAMEFSTVDMDRLAVEYLKMRGIKLPTEVRNLAKAQAPPRADFVVPSRFMPGSLKTGQIRPPARHGSRKKRAE